MEPHSNRRKIVWFFGAGASRGAGAVSSIRGGGKISIPMQSDFWETILRYSLPKDRHTIEQFLFRYFRGYDRTPAKIKSNVRRTYFRQVDVEEVFTFLSERTSTTTITPQLRKYFQDSVWPALLRAVAITFRKFNPNTDTRGVYRDFKNRHFRSWDTIVSFNYDTILEASLGKNRCKYYGLPNKIGSISVYKPHGSVNWSASSNKAVIVSNQNKIPLIVAPTHLKFIGINQPKDHDNFGYLNTNPTISKIWEGMEKQMKESKALVFVGYSFPDADLYFSSVLRTVLTSQSPKIILVNPDSQRIAEKISKRFFIETETISKHFDIKNFCRLNRNDIL